MTEQIPCTRCHGSGRVGYVAGAGWRGHTRCPECQGSRFKPSETPTIPKVISAPANAPRASNAQQTAFPAVADNPQWTPEDEQMFSEAWEAWTWE